MDKTLKEKVLIPSIYVGVKDYFEQKYALDAMNIQNDQNFKILKPRLQRELLDIVFQNFYQQFRTIFADFEGIDPTFKRDIFKNCDFSYYQNSFEDDEEFIEEEWPYRPLIPRIIKAGEYSSKVFFILSGQIHIMSKDGFCDYGILYEGSYFGDISVLLNQPNQFSYFYNPFQENGPNKMMPRAIRLLSIDKDVFKEVCKAHPIPFQKLVMRAK